MMQLSFFKVLADASENDKKSLIENVLTQSGVRFKIVSSDQIVPTLQDERYDLLLTDSADLLQNIRTSTESFRNIPSLSFTSDEWNDANLVITRLNQQAEEIYSLLPVLDPSSIEKIQMFDDEQQSLLRSLYEIYSTDTAEEIRQLGQFVAEADLGNARKKAHKLKSSAAQLGAMRFEKYCNLMEYDADLTSARAQALYSEMKKEYEDSRERFKQTCLTPSQN